MGDKRTYGAFYGPNNKTLASFVETAEHMNKNPLVPYRISSTGVGKKALYLISFDKHDIRL